MNEIMDESMDENVDENKTPNLRKPDEDFSARERNMCMSSAPPSWWVYYLLQLTCACSRRQADFRSLRSFGTSRAGRSDLRGGETLS